MAAACRGFDVPGRHVAADDIDDTVDALAVGEFKDAGDDVFVGVVDGCGGAELAGIVGLGGGGDDAEGGCSEDVRNLDGRAADAA
jgi:hypothetical protein